MPVVAAMIAIDRFGEVASTQPMGPMPSANARLATTRIAAAERVLGPHVDRGDTGSMSGVARLAGSRGAIQRSNTRCKPLACGPASAATARSNASARNEPRDAEHEGGEQRHAHRALRHPIGPGVDPLDRLVHRRSLNR